jgi:2-iminobutanoate/2-iminopropanoate deaminase
MNKALTILAVTLFAGAAHAADSERTFITPPGADPKVAPPYSSGVMVNGTYYVSGTLGVDPATGKVPADAEAEVHLVLDSVKLTLERAGLTMADLVSVTIYCTDLDLYDKFNAVYRSYFQAHYPSRAFIGVAKLVRGARFEIAGIAVKPAKSR